MPLHGVLHWDCYDASCIEAVLGAADEGMREWAKETNAERGGYGGRPVNETKGWSDRMARMWGGDSTYAKAREALADELAPLLSCARRGLPGRSFRPTRRSCRGSGRLVRRACRR